MSLLAAEEAKSILNLRKNDEKDHGGIVSSFPIESNEYDDLIE